MFSVRNTLRLSAKILQASTESSKVITRDFKRWVAPTMKELRRRRKMVGPEPLRPRSSHLEWNYRAEIFAFGSRLHEKFDEKLLRQAFTHRSYIIQEEMKQKDVGIEEPAVLMPDNSQLVENGEELMTKCLDDYVAKALPKMPLDGRIAVRKHLMNQENLAHISSYIGTKDLILSAEFPVTGAILADTLKAIVAALEESSGIERANAFVRDFIFTQLNQKDIDEMWKVPDPLQYLTEYCSRNNLGEVEPRLIGECGKNSILAAYHVGIYCNRQLLGTGFGENVDTAIEEAAKDSLRDIFDTQVCRRPINFQQ
ncbi:large ribosomal subunit protein mL44 [Phlebotomus argentipes]|uniref:large ribosomal subunit protein mL44 n=1 Tax=Phlebotomus argentipes TaxID=94469 RepID=UPI002892DBAE|nr:large ribosomal subunit protein mL44 [Phlebotomus argentipes]